jgi:hypothetical protein
MGEALKQPSKPTTWLLSGLLRNTLELELLYVIVVPVANCALPLVLCVNV